MNRIVEQIRRLEGQIDMHMYVGASRCAIDGTSGRMFSVFKGCVETHLCRCIDPLIRKHLVRGIMEIP